MSTSEFSFASQVADLTHHEASLLKELTGHEVRPAGLLVPKNRADVIRLVQLAQRHRARLHVVSCGRNWGFGSSLPRRSGTWMVSLANLNRIYSYDSETGSVWIEPGVTQIALYRQLQTWGANWFFNVTGAGHGTSVLGNALERGIGYHGQRHLDLIELEVLTGRGEIISTRVESGNPAALGLDLTQLFAQSAIGIVLSARLRLIKRASGGGAAIVRLVNEIHSTELFDRLLELKKDGVVTGVPHVANRLRIFTTMAPWLSTEDRMAFANRISPWTAALPLQGCKEMTEAAFNVIKRSLGQFCEVQTVAASKGWIDEEKVGSPMEQLEQLASGYPSNLALPGVEWTALGNSHLGQTNPDATGAGLIHVTPSVATSVSEIKRGLMIVRQTADSLGLGALPITVNVVDQLLTVLVISVGFPLTAAKAFRRKARMLEKKLKENGIGPYRIGLDQEQWLPNSAPENLLIYRKIRAAMDPFSIFEQSKYAGAFRRTKRLKTSNQTRSRQNAVEVA